MKILGICGSPRGAKSQTRALLDALLAEAKTKGAQVEFVDLGKVRIGFCQACYAVTVGAQFVGSVDARVPLKDTDFASARKLGASMVEAISAKQSWPDQTQAIESQRTRFRNLIAFHKDHWPYEYKYWQDKGWM
ncbi:MAG: NAD(P)H-dependent oxidoreductase [bacterium]|jgi:hypothetical protein